MAENTYAAPGVQVIQSAPPTIPPPNIGAEVVMILGRAPKGPRHLVYCTAAQAQNLFGSDGGNLLTGGFQATGYDIPTAIRLISIQRNPSGNSPINFLVGRVGVAPASLVVKDRTPVTPLPCFTLYGEGQYAGTYGANLAVGITLDGSNNVILLDIMDISAGVGSPVLLQRFNSISSNLTSNASIVAAINSANPINQPASIVSAIIAGGTPTTPAGLVTPTAFSGGAPNDGKAATWADGTVAGLLAESLSYPLDWLWAGFDAALCASNIQANQELALANNNVYYRTVLGPAMGTTYASLSTTYINAITASERVSLVMHDSVFIPNPTSGVPEQRGGPLLAAIVIGMKASGPNNDAAINTPLQGITGIAPAPDNNGLPLSAAQRAALALPSGSTSQSGGIVAWQDPADNGIKLIDTLTTAPYLVNGGKNVFGQLFATHTNDNFNTAVVKATKPFVGRSAPSISKLQQNLVGSAQTQTSQLIGGVSNIGITAPIDQTTGQPVLNASYALVSPLLNANINTSFVIATS